MLAPNNNPLKKYQGIAMNIEHESLTNEPAYEEIKFFSPSSRLNRLRYWAHAMLVTIPFYVVLGISAFLGMQVSVVFWGIAVLAYIAMVAFGFILIIQRLHDLDKSGWLSLIILVPLANLFLLVFLIFFKGTEGRNTYGLPTPPNKTWHWILALGFPVFFLVLGILAAIAMPAYQNYLMGVQQEQIQEMDSQDELLDEVPADEELLGQEENLDGETVDDDIVDDEVVDGDEVVDDAEGDTPSTDATETPDPDIVK
jgi:uncharacterized membrane protein YhaH (DUF805 family)